jgi:hypothetical protein
MMSISYAGRSNVDSSTGAGAADFKLRSITSSGFELGAWLTTGVVSSPRITDEK